MNLPSTIIVILCLIPAALAEARDCVVLLHGLLRTSASMDRLEEEIGQAGFATVNLDYPSRAGSIGQLAEATIPRGLADCDEAATVHFVTHSMGGILVRQYFADHPAGRLGRVVMLGPPNQGTEAVNKLLRVPGMAFLLGPAGSALGSGADYVPAVLPPVDFELGIIAGSRAFNPLLSLLVANPDDGPVSVESTVVAGMCAHLTLDVTHFLMMKNEEVIDQTLSFLQQGAFSLPQARNDLCSRSR